eukprot:scaffold748_cov251-Pinguiococcus_pyrenoidosus.AAC.51
MVEFAGQHAVVSLADRAAAKVLPLLSQSPHHNVGRLALEEALKVPPVFHGGIVDLSQQLGMALPTVATGPAPTKKPQHIPRGGTAKQGTNSAASAPFGQSASPPSSSWGGGTQSFGGSTASKGAGFGGSNPQGFGSGFQSGTKGRPR